MLTAFAPYEDKIPIISGFQVPRITGTPKGSRLPGPPNGLHLSKNKVTKLRALSC